jgi:hypothetical protein
MFVDLYWLQFDGDVYQHYFKVTRQFSSGQPQWKFYKILWALNMMT